ncbi:efflux RND transporter periplasmic adaptor subunit [bacterium]|nr:efflux RND transporter periplasmic adaptor subunit [bacterium]
MKFLKNKWLWISLVIIIVIIVVVKLSSKEEINYVTEKAVIQDLKQTVEVTGSIEAADNIDLNFAGTGTLREVLVSAGDQVKTGQILARLSAGDISAQVADARAALDVAKSDKAQLLAGASFEDLEVTKQEVASARTTYQTALDTLANLEQTRDDELLSLKEEALNTLNDKQIVSQLALNVIYDALLDNEATGYLYVGDVILLESAKGNYNNANNEYLNVSALIDLAEVDNNEDILVAADSLDENLSIILSALSQTFDLMDFVVVNAVYTSTVIDVFKTSLSTQITSINTAISAVQSDISGLRTRDLYYQTQIIDAQNNIDSKLAALNLAEAKLGLKKAPPRDFEIDAADAKIRRAQATLNRYLSNLSETVITAPVEGIITEVNFDVGERSSATQPAISMIGLSAMQIEVDVPESDITKVAVSDQVEITLDAFSSEEKFIGTVTFIDPAATNIDGVIYYQVKVSLNDKDDRIKSGMTADLTIGTESRESVLVVPSRAVIYREGLKYVQVLENSQLAEKEVTTGLKGDGGLIEIISGLDEGEDVITFIKNGK